MSFLDSQFPSHLLSIAQHFSWSQLKMLSLNYNLCRESKAPEDSLEASTMQSHWISSPSLWCSVSRACLENVMLTVERNTAGLLPWLLPQLQDGSLGNPPAPPKVQCFRYCFLGIDSFNLLPLSLGRRKKIVLIACYEGYKEGSPWWLPQLKG